MVGNSHLHSARLKDRILVGYRTTKRQKTFFMNGSTRFGLIFVIGFDLLLTGNLSFFLVIHFFNQRFYKHLNSGRINKSVNVDMNMSM